MRGHVRKQRIARHTGTSCHLDTLRSSLVVFTTPVHSLTAVWYDHIRQKRIFSGWWGEKKSDKGSGEKTGNGNILNDTQHSFKTN